MSDEPFDIKNITPEDNSDMDWDEIIPNPSLNGEPSSTNGNRTSPGAERVKRLFDARNTTPKSPKVSKPIPPKPRPGTLVKPLTDLYTSIGTMMAPFDQPCGMAIVANAEPCAIAMENLARENPAVRRALLAMVETSIWGQVIAAHAPILVTVFMHHNPKLRDAMHQNEQAPNE